MKTFFSDTRLLTAWNAAATLVDWPTAQEGGEFAQKCIAHAAQIAGSSAQECAEICAPPFVANGPNISVETLHFARRLREVLKVQPPAHAWPGKVQSHPRRRRGRRLRRWRLHAESSRLTTGGNP